jgi:hypothetical protein
MSAHRHLRLFAAALLALSLAVAVSSCQRESATPAKGRGPDLTQVFGDGFKDGTPVICKVGDIEITQGQFDKYFAEQPPNVKARYSGEGWERRFLATMVDEALLVHEALARHLDRDAKTSQALISDRRIILGNSVRTQELGADIKPSDAELRAYYEQTKGSYQQLGAREVRHIQTRDHESALAAYNMVKGGTPFPYAVSKYSVNSVSAPKGGDLGWFNKGGFVPGIPYGKEFSETIWGWPIGLHEPVQIHGDWHVIEVLRREEEHQQSFEEARDQVLQAMLPRLKQERLDGFLRQARKQMVVEYFGQYRPGGGRGPLELLRTAKLANTPDAQIDICKQILEDYPDSEYADDALFLMANVYIDAWDDVPSATSALQQLIQEHPDSDLREQAQYLMDNAGKPGFWKPQRLDDLRKAAIQEH